MYFICCLVITSWLCTAHGDGSSNVLVDKFISMQKQLRAQQELRKISLFDSPSLVNNLSKNNAADKPTLFQMNHVSENVNSYSEHPNRSSNYSDSISTIVRPLSLIGIENSKPANAPHARDSSQNGSAPGPTPLISNLVNNNIHTDEEDKENFFVELARRIIDVRKQGPTKTSFIIHPKNVPAPSYLPLPPVATTKDYTYRKISDDHQLDSVNHFKGLTNFTDGSSYPKHSSTTEKLTTSMISGAETSSPNEYIHLEMHPHTTLLGSQDSLIEKLQPKPENEPLVSSLVNQLKDILSNASFVNDIALNRSSSSTPAVEGSTINSVEMTTVSDDTSDTSAGETDGTTRSTTSYGTTNLNTDIIHDEVTNFLKTVASGSGFKGPFVGELIKNFNSLNNNAVKLMYNLLISPLTATSSTTQSSVQLHKLNSEEFSTLKESSVFEPSEPVPNSVLISDQMDDDTWAPYRSTSRSSRGGGLIAVITAPPAKKFELVVGSSLHSEPRQNSEFNRRSGIPNIRSLQVGVGVPPPDAMKALPRGAQLVSPSQLMRLPNIPRIAFNEENIPVPITKIRPSDSPAHKKDQNSSAMSALSSLPSFIASFFSSKPVNRRNHNKQEQRNRNEPSHRAWNPTQRRRLPEQNQFDLNPEEMIFSHENDEHFFPVDDSSILRAPGPMPVNKIIQQHNSFTENLAPVSHKITHDSSPSSPESAFHVHDVKEYVSSIGYHHQGHDSHIPDANVPVSYVGDENEFVTEESSHFAVRHHADPYQTYDLHSNDQPHDFEPLKREHIIDNDQSESKYYVHEPNSKQYNDYEYENQYDDHGTFNGKLPDVNIEDHNMDDYSFKPMHVETVERQDHSDHFHMGDEVKIELKNKSTDYHFPNNIADVTNSVNKLIPRPVIIDTDQPGNSSDYDNDFSYDEPVHPISNVFKLRPIRYQEDIPISEDDTFVREKNEVYKTSESLDTFKAQKVDDSNIALFSHSDELAGNGKTVLAHENDFEKTGFNSKHSDPNNVELSHNNFGEKVVEEAVNEHDYEEVADESIPHGRITEYAGTPPVKPFDDSNVEVNYSSADKYDYYDYSYDNPTAGDVMENDHINEKSKPNLDRIEFLSNKSASVNDSDPFPVVQGVASMDSSQVISPDQARIFNHNHAKSHREDTSNFEIHVNDPVEPIDSLSKIDINQMFTDDSQYFDPVIHVEDSNRPLKHQPKLYRRPSSPAPVDDSDPEPDDSATYLFNTIDLIPHSADSFNTRYVVNDSKNIPKMRNTSLKEEQINFTVNNLNEIVEELAPADEYMAYVLIGSCVSLALLSITGVLLIIKFKKSCGSRQIRSRQRISKGSLPNVSHSPETFLESDAGGHKLGSWFTGKGGTFGSSKLRSNMALPGVEDLRRDHPERSSSQRDLLSITSDSSGNTSHRSMERNFDNEQKKKATEKSKESWIQSDSVNHNNETNEHVDLTKEFKRTSRHQSGNETLDTKKRRHRDPATSHDTDFLTNKSEGEFYTTDSEFYDPTSCGEDEESSRYMEDSHDVDTIDKMRSRSVTTSQELGEKLSHDIRHFQDRENSVTSRESTVDKKLKRSNDGGNLRRTTSEASFTRDNVQNEVFLEFDNIFKQHGQYLTASDGQQSSMERTSDNKRPNSPDSIETQKANANDRRRFPSGNSGPKQNTTTNNRHHRTRSASVSSAKKVAGGSSTISKSPPTPPRFTPPPPPPRPPKPDRLTKASAPGGTIESNKMSSSDRKDRDDRLV